MNVREMTEQLSELYPVEYNYGSYASLYGRGLRDNIITKSDYDAARKFYGTLFNYTGD